MMSQLSVGDLPWDTKRKKTGYDCEISHIGDYLCYSVEKFFEELFVRAPACCKPRNKSA